MKQWLFRFGAFFIAIALLTGCGNDEAGNPDTKTNQSSEKREVQKEQAEETVLITISKDDGAEYLHEKEIPIEEGAILMNVMEENFYIETEQNGEFITSIERLSAKDGEKKGWIYTVNGEMPNVGAAEYKLKPGDKVVFDFQAWE
ncbi:MULTISPECIES: DUF4430 domain-containing protein [Clostridia]|uniref:DUF4430 domain-containing protein n=1 Tax=Clostridia TaxID=186801 RepID=UPI000EA097A7|nr:MULTISPECIES: DUF4430 domain-containing protein [Clostridia]NBJ70460.1 DUF4430 domain-containing protein [Roseburia sp. 1XD42-34]RKI76115.1 DUF4430 domain-containing protein [Clostridium sp. 1xD42-85]